MLIPCPVCGPRDHEEFAYGGDATVARPTIAEQSATAWATFVYDRTNPKGAHQEHWHHVHGCRQWMVVSRDTETHAVTGARLIGAWAEPETEPGDD